MNIQLVKQHERLSLGETHWHTLCLMMRYCNCKWRDVSSVHNAGPFLTLFPRCQLSDTAWDRTLHKLGPWLIHCGSFYSLILIRNRSLAQKPKFGKSHSWECRARQAGPRGSVSHPYRFQGPGLGLSPTVGFSWWFLKAASPLQGRHFPGWLLQIDPNYPFLSSRARETWPSLGHQPRR